MIFIVVFTLPLIYMLINVPEGRPFMLGFFIFFLLLVSLGTYSLLRRRREYRRAENFASLVGFSDSGVTFPEEIEFETGTLEMRGYWVGSGKSRSYHVERKFVLGEKKRASRVPFMGSPFKVAVSPDGTGLVKGSRCEDNR